MNDNRSIEPYNIEERGGVLSSTIIPIMRNMIIRYDALIWGMCSADIVKVWIVTLAQAFVNQVSCNVVRKIGRVQWRRRISNANTVNSSYVCLLFISFDYCYYY